MFCGGGGDGDGDDDNDNNDVHHDVGDGLFTSWGQSWVCLLLIRRFNVLHQRLQLRQQRRWFHHL